MTDVNDDSWSTHDNNRWFLAQSRSVYLVDFTTYKPPEDWKVSQAEVMEIMKRKKCFTEESLDFMERILVNSGTGEDSMMMTRISMRMIE